MYTHIIRAYTLSSVRGARFPNSSPLLSLAARNFILFFLIVVVAAAAAVAVAVVVVWRGGFSVESQ